MITISHTVRTMRVLLHDSSVGIESDELLRALVSGLLVVVAASVVGTWVVLRGLTFLGEALAHAVIPGAAVALLLGFDPVLGAALSAALLVGGIGLVDRRTQVGHDASIGLLFVGMLAVGLIALSSSHAEDVERLLFGDIAHADWGDIAVQAIAALVVVAGSVLGYRALLASSFNEAKAASLGLRPGLAHVGLLALVAVAVVASFRSAGSLLAFGLLVGPPATALLLVRRVWVSMLVSVALGWGAVVVGLLIARRYDTPGGATMAGVAVALFFVVLLGQEVRAHVRVRHATPELAA
jgi:ABC-type Mn2+/Zn2+ transport system permease subunit